MELYHRMKRLSLLNSLKDKRLAAHITLNNQIVVFDKHTKELIFKGEFDDFLYKLGIEFHMDFRL